MHQRSGLQRSSGRVRVCLCSWLHWSDVWRWVEYNAIKTLCSSHCFFFNVIAVDINECASNPCSSVSSCLDQIDAFSCQCPIGYTGLLCESKNLACLQHTHDLFVGQYQIFVFQWHVWIIHALLTSLLGNPWVVEAITWKFNDQAKARVL